MRVSLLFLCFCAVNEWTRSLHIDNMIFAKKNTQRITRALFISSDSFSFCVSIVGILIVFPWRKITLILLLLLHLYLQTHTHTDSNIKTCSWHFPTKHFRVFHPGISSGNIRANLLTLQIMDYCIIESKYIQYILYTLSVSHWLVDLSGFIQGSTIYSHD